MKYTPVEIIIKHFTNALHNCLKDFKGILKYVKKRSHGILKWPLIFVYINM